MAKKSKKTRIFSALEVANICGVVNQTTINWIKSGYLKAFTTPGGQYRVYAEDLAQFLGSRDMKLPDELETVLVEANDISFLVIDDDKELNALLCEKLSSAFPLSTIEKAYDGFEAGSLLARFKPSVVLLDINLPGVNGLTICKNIKKDPELGNPVVVAISGMDDPDERAAVLDQGVEAFFSKPLDFVALIETLKSFLPGGGK